MRALDLIGKRFGRLIVTSRAGSKNNNAAWNCKCDCGGIAVVTSGHLVSGDVASCKCLRNEIARANRISEAKHGDYKSRTYGSWSSMRERCLTPSCKQYKNYGGRGILICERWNQYENFRADMGERPPNHTLDRIDVNGNYEPSNCRWATAKQQARNRRDNVRVDFRGAQLTAPEISEITGASVRLCRSRMKFGRMRLFQ